MRVFTIDIYSKRARVFPRESEYDKRMSPSDALNLLHPNVPLRIFFTLTAAKKYLDNMVDDCGTLAFHAVFEILVDPYLIITEGCSHQINTKDVLHVASCDVERYPYGHSHHWQYKIGTWKTEYDVFHQAVGQYKKKINKESIFNTLNIMVKKYRHFFKNWISIFFDDEHFINSLQSALDEKNSLSKIYRILKEAQENLPYNKISHEREFLASALEYLIKHAAALLEEATNYCLDENLCEMVRKYYLPVVEKLLIGKEHVNSFLEQDQCEEISNIMRNVKEKNKCIVAVWLAARFRGDNKTLSVKDCLTGECDSLFRSNLFFLRSDKYPITKMGELKSAGEAYQCMMEHLKLGGEGYLCIVDLSSESAEKMLLDETMCEKFHQHIMYLIPGNAWNDFNNSFFQPVENKKNVIIIKNPYYHSEVVEYEEKFLSPTK